MATVNLTIDNIKVSVPEGSTILEAAKSVGITIPTLCAWPEIHHTPGACRVCVTEVEGQRNLVASCVFPV
ncbi:MAG TPA: 2Fe-2S iron-sulfur cluster-binding protein, partial [Deltaproteobacteria bacterium]|nr:2Fe-2S iron-sulfur cluster-binding protein [Deltaproteobacteria bacterium]